MRLTWLGTAALLIETDGGLLAVDPFPGLPLGGWKGRPLPEAETFRRAGSVLATHGHFDHILCIPELYRDTATRVYASAAPCATLRRMGFDPARLTEIGPGWPGGVEGLRIRALQGRHCRFDARTVLRTVFRPRFFAHLGHMLRLEAAHRRCPERGETLFFELSDSDQTRLQVLGSLGLDPGVDYPTGADALVMAFQGRSDLEEKGLEIAARLRPKRVLLDHWDDAFPPMSSEVPTARFCALVRERLGFDCRALRRDETIEIKGGTPHGQR